MTTTDDARVMPQSPCHAAAVMYLAKGWSPTPLVPGDKIARLLEWQQTRIDEAGISHLFGPDDNVGLVLGALSGGLVDVDLDCPEAVLAASRLLPATGLRSGRASRPESHRFYVCDPVPEAKRLTYADPLGGSMLLEVRGTGHQTMVPPSIHPTGESLVWHRFDEPARVEREEFLDHVGRTAAVTLLARHWPGPGAHHDATMALAGGLVRAAWSEEEIVAFVQAVCTVAGDTHELPDRIACVRSTVAAHGAGQQTTGWQRLREEHFDPKVVAKVREWLGLASVLDDDRPAIDAGDGDLSRQTALAWKALSAANEPPTLFRRASMPVRVELDDDAKRPILRGLTVDRMRYHLAEAVHWYRVTKHGPEPAHAPVDVVRNVLAVPDPPLPVLTRVVTAPIFAANGELQTEPGYSTATRAYYHPSEGLVVPPVPENPTAAQIAAARSLLLDELLADFPFEGEAERANAVAALLLPFGRDLIVGPTPLHLIEAPAPGTGKTLLAEMLTSPVQGAGGAAAMTEAGDDDEWRKRITAALLTGAPFLFVDNLKRPLDSGALAGALTATEWEDRLLGVNEIVRMSVRCVWLATANNVAVSDEMARRSVRIRLNAKRDRPFEREDFRHLLPAWANDHRGEVVAAALTLWRAWLAAGRPQGGTTLGMFDPWARTMGGVLAVAGISGFLDNARAFYDEADVSSRRWRALVAAWWEQFGSEWVGAGELLPLAEEIEGFNLLGGFRYEQGNRTKLGQMLRDQRDRFFGDYQIRVEEDKKRKTLRYRLWRSDGEERARQEHSQPTGWLASGGFSGGGA